MPFHVGDQLVVRVGRPISGVGRVGVAPVVPRHHPSVGRELIDHISEVEPTAGEPVHQHEGHAPTPRSSTAISTPLTPTIRSGVVPMRRIMSHAQSRSTSSVTPHGSGAYRRGDGDDPVDEPDEHDMPPAATTSAPESTTTPAPARTPVSSR